MNLKEQGGVCGMDYFGSAKVYRTLVNIIMNVRVPNIGREFLDQLSDCQRTFKSAMNVNLNLLVRTFKGNECV